MKNAVKSKVMIIANKLVAQGWGRAAAMIRAWAVVKLLPRLETKVAGVTYGSRQLSLEHLSMYAPEAVSIHLERERDNEADSNAVAVYAAVAGRGSFCVGYLPRTVASFVAPLLDAGKAVGAMFREVRGKYNRLSPDLRNAPPCRMYNMEPQTRYILPRTVDPRPVLRVYPAIHDARKWNPSITGKRAIEDCGVVGFQ